MEHNLTQDDRNTEGADYFPFDEVDEASEDGGYDRRPHELEQSVRDHLEELIEDALVTLKLQDGSDSPDEVRTVEALMQAQIDKVRSLRADLAETCGQPTLPFSMDALLESGQRAHYMLALLMMHGDFAHARERERQGAGAGVWGWLYGGRTIKSGIQFAGILAQTVAWVGTLSDKDVHELLPTYLAEYGITIPYEALVWRHLPWEEVTDKRLAKVVPEWIRYLADGDGKTVTVTEYARPDRPFAYGERLARGGEVETRITPADRLSTSRGTPETVRPGTYGFPRVFVDLVEGVFPSGQKRAEVFLIRNTPVIRQRIATCLQPEIVRFARTLGTTMRFPVSTEPAYRLVSAIYWGTTKRKSTRGWVLDASGLTVDHAEAILERVSRYHRFLQGFFWRTWMDNQRLTEYLGKASGLIAGLL